jgi:hypothetical protein
VVVSHVAAVIYLTGIIGLGLYRSYDELRPSQDTRLRIARRQKTIPVFASLALVALVLNSYYTSNYLVLSYKVWADERGIMIPARYEARRSRRRNPRTDLNTPA